MKKRAKKWRSNRKVPHVPLTEAERKLVEAWRRYEESEKRVSEWTKKAWLQMLGVKEKSP